MFDSTDRSRAVWVGLALVLGAALCLVLYAFVGTFVLGLFLYYAARPVYVRLRRRLRPASLAAAVALFVLVLPVVLLFAYAAALAVGELQSLGELDLSAYEALLAPYADLVGLTREFQAVLYSLLSDPERILTESRLRAVVTELVAAATAYLGVFLVGLLHLFVAVALAFYLLRDGDRLAAWVRATFPDETLVAYGRAVDADLKTVFFGNILNALLAGIIGAVSFSALAAVAPTGVSLPVPVLLGLLAGAASLVPVIGMKVVYVPATLYLAGRALLVGPRSLWFPALFFAVSFVVVDSIPDLVLRPYVSGRHLHVGAVMFAYVLGPLLFGWYGLFLAPLLLVLVVDFARVVVPELVGPVDEPAATSDDVGGERPDHDGGARRPDESTGDGASEECDGSDGEPT
jgi:predicted PurR-regulated permease PerM